VVENGFSDQDKDWMKKIIEREVEEQKYGWACKRKLLF
jgi:hypothetical protein